VDAVNQPQFSELGQAAYKRCAASLYAQEVGWPVLKVKLDKTPATPHGYKDGTTEPSTIDHSWPPGVRDEDLPNIGIVTGQRSGIVVFDIDPRNGGQLLKHGTGYSIFSNGELIGKVPPTRVHLTGGGGWHAYLNCTSPIRSREIAPGVELKGDGSYVIAPPSVHQNGTPYTVLDSDSSTAYGLLMGLLTIPIADAPDWLLSYHQQHQTISNNSPSGDRIPEGTRNNTLTSIAGRRRWEGASREILASEAHIINTNQCDPPLPKRDVDNIVDFITKKPAGTGRPREEYETARAQIDRITAQISRHQWCGPGAASQRDVLLALLQIGHKTGKLIVHASIRDLALRAGYHHMTVWKALKKLRANGWIRLTRGNGDDKRKGHEYEILGNTQSAYTHTTGRGGVYADCAHLGDDLWRIRIGLGPQARLVFSALSNGPVRSVADLVRATGVNRFEKLNLVVKATGEWCLLEPDVEQVRARLRRVLPSLRFGGKHEKEKRRYQADRHWYHFILEQTPKLIAATGEPESRIVWALVELKKRQFIIEGLNGWEPTRDLVELVVSCLKVDRRPCDESLKLVGDDEYVDPETGEVLGMLYGAATCEKRKGFSAPFFPVENLPRSGTGA